MFKIFILGKNNANLLILIILMIIIGLNSGMNTFIWIYKYFKSKHNYLNASRVIYRRKTNDSTTILIRDEQDEQ